MKTNEGWAILPLTNIIDCKTYNISGTIDDRRHNLHDNITVDEIKKYGWIFSRMDLATNENVLAYLKNRIKEFYYSYNLSDVIVTEGIYKLSSYTFDYFN
jgi:hypothetical protein